ncbi:hypothetical protein FQN49_005361 [Arthroderma sp. PD_2]|nr:hypothetical protein FQN49_005361 [Arthroderma sp. PD_2]
MAKRALQSLLARCSFGRRQPTAFCGAPKELPMDTLIDEETVPGYQASHYFPVRPGYIFNQRYEAISKLGWGRHSTVWLVRDLKGWYSHPERYLALKVSNHNIHAETFASYELGMEHLIARTDSWHKGCNYIRTYAEYFVAEGPNGAHICLAYEPMRESIAMLQSRFQIQRFSLGLLKVYIKILLRGLDYLHTERGIVHTNLRPKNILVSFEEPSALEDFAQLQASSPISRKSKDGTTLYLSQNDFGPLRSYFVYPKITDFGMAYELDDPTLMNRHLTLPDQYRPPEVILGATWTCSADIWNLGLLMWNLLEGRDLFIPPIDSLGNYRPDAHLAHMTALLGPPPQELIRREREGMGPKWDSPVKSPTGEMCSSAAEWYGGPFFDQNGEFLHRYPIPTGISLEDTVTCLEGEKKEQFLEFARKMLQWLPEDRKTAKELIDDPWLSIESIKQEEA